MLRQWRDDFLDDLLHHSHMEMANGISAMLNEQSVLCLGSSGLGARKRATVFSFFGGDLPQVCGRET